MGMRSFFDALGSRFRESYSGTLYPKKNRSLFFFLFRRILDRVRIADESAAEIQDLARKGTVIYGLKNRSQINTLILENLTERTGLPVPVYSHGVNMLLWQPFLKAVRSFLTRPFHNPDRLGYLGRIAEGKESAVIYLRGSEFFGSRWVRDPLLQLMEKQKDLAHPIFIVPVLVSYGRRREKKDKTLWDLLFGDVENPGPLRRTVNFFRFSKKAFVVASEPVDLQSFLDRTRSRTTETASYLLRKRLIEGINEEKRSIVGPVLKSREELIGKILREPEFVSFIRDFAESEGRDVQDLVQQSKKFLYEIASDYNEVYTGLWDKFLTWLWHDIYDGVVIDREGLARMRAVSKKMPFVVIPCHRSHIDYLFLSYVFYHNNIQLPFIAAGTNLMFWPLGHIFRRSGAFFIRRSFKGDVLYPEVFSRYLKALLEEGFPIEFFIEGGRSRTGKMVMPKYGLISMVIQAYREGACEDLALIPAYIGYDRVIEEKSYLREIGGESKAVENTKGLFRSRKILRKRYGSVYLNIAEPIFLRDYMASQEGPFEGMDTEDRRAFYRKISYDIASRINRVTVVTPFSLAASALLAHFRRGISHMDFMSMAAEFFDYLTRRGAKFASTFVHREKAVIDALTRFESLGLISRMGPEEGEEMEELSETVYSVDEDKRMNLEYYKNNILHFFIPLAFVAASVLSAAEDRVLLQKILEDYRFFKRMFRHEFIFDDAVDDADEVNDVLAYIHDSRMIEGHLDDPEAPWIEVKGKGRLGLVPYYGLIHNYIESYWIALRGATVLRGRKKGEKDFLKALQKLGTKMYKKGEISKTEALSVPNYKNALRFLLDGEVVLSENIAGARGDSPVFTLNDEKTGLEALRAQIFRFM